MKIQINLNDLILIRDILVKKGQLKNNQVKFNNIILENKLPRFDIIRIATKELPLLNSCLEAVKKSIVIANTYTIQEKIFRRSSLSTTIKNLKSYPTYEEIGKCKAILTKDIIDKEVLKLSTELDLLTGELNAFKLNTTAIIDTTHENSTFLSTFIKQEGFNFKLIKKQNEELIT